MTFIKSKRLDVTAVVEDRTISFLLPLLLHMHTVLGFALRRNKNEIKRFIVKNDSSQPFISTAVFTALSCFHIQRVKKPAGFVMIRGQGPDSFRSHTRRADDLKSGGRSAVCSRPRRKSGQALHLHILFCSCRPRLFIRLLSSRIRCRSPHDAVAFVPSLESAIGGMSPRNRIALPTA